MTQHTYNEWVADIDATHLEGSHLEFKFVAFRNAKNVSSLGNQHEQNRGFAGDEGR